MAQNLGQMENDLDYVMRQLQSRVVPRSQIERDTGLDESWLTKLSLGLIADPGHRKVTRLGDYFRLLERQGQQRVEFGRVQSSNANSGTELSLDAQIQESLG